MPLPGSPAIPSLPQPLHPRPKPRDSSGVYLGPREPPSTPASPRHLHTNDAAPERPSDHPGPSPLRRRFFAMSPVPGIGPCCLFPSRKPPCVEPPGRGPREADWERRVPQGTGGCVAVRGLETRGWGPKAPPVGVSSATAAPPPHVRERARGGAGVASQEESQVGGDEADAAAHAAGDGVPAAVIRALACVLAI